MSINIENEVRPEIRSMLRRLRGRIRQYVLVDAFARIIAVLGILFWLSFGMNWAYFKLSNLELPVWFRMAFGWASIAGSLIFAVWLLAPLLKMMRAKALALILERRFPELDDRLITSVEVAESRGQHESELTAHMLKNTIDNVSQTVDKLHIGDVFDKRPRKRALTLAFTLLISIGALAVVNFDSMKLWASAYINYEDVYWDRQTTIIIKVIAQPNDREKDFLDKDGKPTDGKPGTYRHPRDEELALVIEVPSRAAPIEALATRQHAIHTQLAEAAKIADPKGLKLALAKIEAAQSQLTADANQLPAGSRMTRIQYSELKQAQASIAKAAASANADDVEAAAKTVSASAGMLDDYAGLLHKNDWKVPERIDLDYRLAEGRGGSDITLRRKDKNSRTFLHSIGGLTDTIDALYVSGGDFANRQPYRVEVVDAPRIDRIVLEANYPDYTGRDAFDEEGNPIRDNRRLQGSQTSLPMETDFLLHAFGNKRLVGVRLQADINEQDVRNIEVNLKPYRQNVAASAQFIVTAVDGSRRTIDLPAELLWRYRLLPTEADLAKRFKAIIKTIGEIRETPDADGKMHRLSQNTASDGLARLGNLAKDSQEIEAAYRKLLEDLDRNPVYSRLIVEKMQSVILTPLAGINAQLFPATQRLLETLNATGEGDTGTHDRTVAARKGVEVMLLAMNNVYDEMSDGTRFDVPFHITSNALAQLADTENSITAPLPLPADREIRIYLEDTDDIIGTNPTRLTINGIADQPPQVETQLRGISSAITRLATIPVDGVIRDDYGIVKAHFEFLVDAETQTAEAKAAGDAAAEEQPPAEAVDQEQPAWRNRQFRLRPEGEPLEFNLDYPNDRYSTARFEVLPLDLQIGQELTLTVFAEDGDNLNGPHKTRGEKYRFRIVSKEELLSLLNNRELDIRRRFEQIIEEVQETKKDLELHRGRLVEGEAIRAGDATDKEAKLREIDDAVGNAAGRSFHQASKNQSETEAVTRTFREQLEELTNNKIHTEEQVRRIESLIVAPLEEITKNDFPAVLSSVNLFKQSHEKGVDSRRQIGDSIELIDTLLLHMQKVLSEMKELIGFHEAIKKLGEIIDIQSDIAKEAREKQKREAIEKLKKLGLD